MGLSQSTIANKLRLLKLASPVREKIYKLRLTERHARALLELSDTDSQLEALKYAEQTNFTVRDWEELIRQECSPENGKNIPGK